MIYFYIINGGLAFAQFLLFGLALLHLFDIKHLPTKDFMILFAINITLYGLEKVLESQI